ncbi:unnamed protein product [Adineta steineri]|uniref:NAD(P)(+)--arginine ADP-ribosyltransferase n=2 Tax=Adineta steineri TaxID=433720 RepID=A0A815C594_9BILA|nr:unnamed protein product [Adineta steineri]CAF4094377.1 unnamed protein product [Adineta steineri]
MAAIGEEEMELSQRLLDDQKKNQIEKYFSLVNSVKTISRMGAYGMVDLHFVSCYGQKEIIQFVFTNSAFMSLEGVSSELVPYDESNKDAIKTLVLKTCNLHAFEEDMPDNDYIDWSSNGEKLVKKAKEFREQIDLYKTYDNQHHLITKILIEIIEYYLNDYLVEKEHFSLDHIREIQSCFEKAIEEQNYLIYFIKAYTLTNNFHGVLNKHLALYILHYFDRPSSPSLRTKYHLINCLVYIVTLVINHPDIHKYKYNGITYRGVLMNRNDLKYYTIGNYILNRSFVSTSKKRSVAQAFAGDESLVGISDQHQSTEVPVLMKYTITQNHSAIDIAAISTIQDEEEILILPFSVFKVIDKIENYSNMSLPVLVEIDLEEYEDNEEINNKKQKSE